MNSSYKWPCADHEVGDSEGWQLKALWIFDTRMKWVDGLGRIFKPSPPRFAKPQEWRCCGGASCICLCCYRLLGSLRYRQLYTYRNSNCLWHSDTPLWHQCGLSLARLKHRLFWKLWEGGPSWQPSLGDQAHLRGKLSNESWPNPMAP